MSEPTSPFSRTSGWGPLIALALLFAMFAGGGLVLVWPRLQGARWAPRLTQCRNNLKGIELALHSYHDKHGSFPPAVVYGADGTPWHSWRLLILPHIGEDGAKIAARYRFDEPWNGPSNRRLADDEQAASFFRCPTEQRFGPPTTSYLAVVGEKTLWPPHESTGLRDVSDDQSRTIHVVEFSDSGVLWSEPRDLKFDPATCAVQTGKGDTVRSRHPGLPYVSFVDGSVTPLSSETRPQTVRSMLLRDDGGPKAEDVP